MWRKWRKQRQIVEIDQNRDLRHFAGADLEEAGQTHRTPVEQLARKLLGHAAVEVPLRIDAVDEDGRRVDVVGEPVAEDELVQVPEQVECVLGDEGQGEEPQIEERVAGPGADVGDRPPDSADRHGVRRFEAVVTSGVGQQQEQEHDRAHRAWSAAFGVIG